MRNLRARFSFIRFFVIIFIAIILIVIIFPLLWMFSLSLREPQQVTEAYAYLIPKKFAFNNYYRGFEWARDKLRVPLPVLYKNSIIVTFSSVLVTIIIATLASFSLSKLKFRRKKFIFYVILFGMMIPSQMLLIPIFIITKNLKLLNTYFSLILPYIAFGLPISIFILRGFFNQIPDEICESAKIDGASDFTVFLRIILPLTKPALATCVILLFLQNWNEFMLALVILLRDKFYTVTVGLSKVASIYIFPWEVYSSLVWLASIPIIIIFVIFQNWFIKGLTAGAIKG